MVIKQSESDRFRQRLFDQVDQHERREAIGGLVAGHWQDESQGCIECAMRQAWNLGYQHRVELDWKDLEDRDRREALREELRHEARQELRVPVSPDPGVN